jgi:multimeric flavodoxin WrbA
VSADIAKPESRILIVNGSPRAGGNSTVLARHIAAAATSERVDADVVHLRELDLSSCVGCERCRRDGACTRFDDDMVALYDMVSRARGLALLSPVHNYNVTAWMKAFIDRLYCYYEFDDPRPGPWWSTLAGQHRVASVAAVAEQPDIADAGFVLEAMRRPLEALGYAVLDEALVLGVFCKGGVSDRPDALSAAEEMGRTLGRSIRGGAE